MSGGDLFRPEAIEAARARIGLPFNNFGVKSWVIVAFMTFVFASSVTFISLARYSKKETVLGSITPSSGVARVATLRAGTIKAVKVKAGDWVAQGQDIAVISFDPVLEGGAPLATQINAATEAQVRASQWQASVKKQQYFETQTELRVRKQGLEHDLLTLAAQKDLQEKRVSLLRETVTSMRDLAHKQYVSLVKLRSAEDTLLQAEQSLTQLEQSINQAQAQIGQIESQIQSAGLGAREMDAQSNLSRAQYDEKRLGDMSSQKAEIVAQKSGRIASLQIREGDVVAANQTLGLITPETTQQPLEVQLWVPSRAIGFVQTGNQVRLMFDAFPYQTFGVGKGQVTEISTAPLMPNELPIPIETKEQMYKVTVRLDRADLMAYGRHWPLTAGMRLTADLVLDERSLLDWLLDPLLASRQRAGQKGLFST